MEIVKEHEQFVPMALQEGPVKSHTILLHPEIPDEPFSEGVVLTEKKSRCCRSDILSKRIDHRFGWGDITKLNCVVENVPGYQCSCGSETYLTDNAAWPIKEQSLAIQYFFEFAEMDRLDSFPNFLEANGLAKLCDFTAHLVKDRKDVEESRSRWKSMKELTK